TTYKDGGIAFVPRAFFLLWALEYLVVTLSKVGWFNSSDSEIITEQSIDIGYTSSGGQQGNVGGGKVPNDTVRLYFSNNIRF
ncbi:MAG: hypothetical protein JXB50_13150, partial [Spirochaetes bacterium]|nr:hypothetical protein [Spirochaetota bacterium]